MKNRKVFIITLFVFFSLIAAPALPDPIDDLKEMKRDLQLNLAQATSAADAISQQRLREAIARIDQLLLELEDVANRLVDRGVEEMNTIFARAEAEIDEVMQLAQSIQSTFIQDARCAASLIVSEIDRLPQTLMGSSFASVYADQEKDSLSRISKRRWWWDGEPRLEPSELADEYLQMASRANAILCRLANDGITAREPDVVTPYLQDFKTYSRKAALWQWSSAL